MGASVAEQSGKSVPKAACLLLVFLITLLCKQSIHLSNMFLYAVTVMQVCSVFIDFLWISNMFNYTFKTRLAYYMRLTMVMYFSKTSCTL